MPITFYALSGSPFAWKVWLALEHKGLPYTLRVLSAEKGELKTPEFLALNPRGKVPVIVDDGFALAESSVIVEYLEDACGATGPALWPVDPKARARARRLSAECDGVIYPYVRTLVRELLMRPSGEPDGASIAAAREALEQELHSQAAAFRGPFMAGDAPTAADYTIYPMLALLKRVQSRRPEQNVLSIVPEVLQAWMGRVEALPYFAKTTPPHWKVS